MNVETPSSAELQAFAIYSPTGVAITPAQDGVDATGVTAPTGGSGIRGWLSGLYSKIASAVVSGVMQVTQFVGGAAVSTSNPVPIFDGYGAPQVATWTSATALNTALTSSTAGMDCVAVTIQPTGTITGGAITFEVYDGANWVPIKCARETSYNTDSAYSLAGASTIQGWTIPAAAFPQARARLSTAITGSGNVLITTIVSSAPDVSIATVGLDPLQSQHPGVLTETVAQVLAIGSTSATSSLTNAPTNRVILTPTADCWVMLGSAPTAAVPSGTASSGPIFLPASCPSYPIAVTGGTTKIAVVANVSTSAGYLSILESV